jgi:hypothetical protein
MGAYSDRVIADGASAYWRLGETSGLTAVDSVGGANGTISGGVTLGAAGAIADGTKAMTFDGTTGKIVTAGSVTLPAAFTFEAWLRMTAPTGDRPIMSTPFTGGHYHYSLRTIDGHLALILYDPAVVSIAGGSSALSVADGAWHQVVYRFPGGLTFEMYVDGRLDDVPKPLTHAIAADAQPMELGWYGNGSLFWLGSLDEVAIYPRALTLAEIAAHYLVARQSQSWPGVPWWVQIQGGDILDSYNVWEPITPSDTVNLPRGNTGGVWVGTGGDVAAVMGNNVMPVVLAAVPTGAWLPIAAKRINATGTTATGLVALYEI